MNKKDYVENAIKTLQSENLKRFALVVEEEINGRVGYKHNIYDYNAGILFHLTELVNVMKYQIQKITLDYIRSTDQEERWISKKK